MFKSLKKIEIQQPWLHTFSRMRIELVMRAEVFGKKQNIDT